MREVDDCLRDELGVRHDEAGAPERLDLGRADGDAAHIAFALLERHPVADLDRSLDKQDEAGNEVVDDGLQAKADADRQCAGDDGKAGDVEACVRNGGQRSDGKADVAGTGVDRVGKPRLDAPFGQRSGGQPALHEARRDQDAGEQCDGGKNAGERDTHAADVEAEDCPAQPTGDLGPAESPGQQQERHGDGEKRDVEQNALRRGSAGCGRSRRA